MTKPKIQIGDVVREMTDEEFAAHKTDIETQIAAEKQLQEAKMSALKKLEVLGLTEQEIIALVG